MIQVTVPNFFYFNKISKTRVLGPKNCTFWPYLWKRVKNNGFLALAPSIWYSVRKGYADCGPPLPRVAEFFQNSIGISSNINIRLVSAYLAKKWKKNFFWPWESIFSFFGRFFRQILVFIKFDQLRIIVQICDYTQIKANCKLYLE